MYSTTGDELTLADPYNETDYAYCVEAGTLSMTLLSQGSLGTVAGQIVFQQLE